MIATISKQGGRRYPQMRGSLQRALWLPSVGTTVAPPVIGLVPEDRRAYVAADVRAARVLIDDRTAFVPADDRRARILRG